MKNAYNRREFLRLAGKSTSMLALFSGLIRFNAPAQAQDEAQEGELLVNRLLHGEDQLKVIFLERNNEERSDSFILLYLSENGLDIILHDGGLNDRQTLQALLNLREEILAKAGVDAQAAANYRLDMQLVFSHFHMDHVEGIYGLIARANKKLRFNTAYIPPCASLGLGIYSDGHNGDRTHRPKFHKIVEQYQPQCTVKELDWGETCLLETEIGEVRLFAPVNDWSTPEKMLMFDNDYGYKTSSSRLVSLPQAAINSNSVWLRAALGDYSFLFTGDVDKRLEDRNDEPMDEVVAEYGEALRSDVIKYPHHGIVRNAAAPLIRDKLITDKEERVCILTAPKAYKHAGAVLTELGVPWLDLESGSIIFTVKDGKMTREIIKNAKSFL